MTVEAPDQQPNYQKNQELRIEEWVLAFLEQYDGLCLDNEEERATLATVLATALISPESPHQKTESSFFPLSVECVSGVFTQSPEKIQSKLTTRGRNSKIKSEN
jgi:hypothetical protein